MLIILSVFRQILISSVMAVVLAGLILIVRKMCRNRFDAGWQYCIWLLLLIKLTVPYMPESPVSIPNTVTAAVQKVPFVDKLMLLASDDIQLDEYSLKFDENENSQNNTDQSTKQSDIAEPKVAVSGDTVAAQDSNSGEDKNYSDILMILFKVWAAGCALLVCYTAAINIRFIRQIRNCYYCDDQRVNDIHKECKKKTNVKRAVPVFITIQSKAPALYGILNPRILFSEKYLHLLKDDEIKYILLHELFHYKRKDILVNWLMVVLQIIHWFNPVVWYCFHLMREDCEMACDEKVLSCIDSDERKKYGQTIINLVKEVNESCYIPSTAGFMKKSSSVKRRIMMISRFRKKSWLRAVAAAVLIIALGLVGIPGYKSMAADDERVSFESEQLAKAIRSALGKDKGSVIYKSELLKVKRVDAIGTSDISELQDCKNLEFLQLLNPKDIKTLSSLKNLKNLKTLAIAGLKENNNLQELRGLTQLEDLEIYGCYDLNDIDILSNLSRLKTLKIRNGSSSSKLTDNSLTALSKITGLRELVLERIPITDLKPLQELINIRSVWIWDSQVKDISPLKNLTKIERLRLTSSKVKDISPVAGLKSLKEIGLINSLIEDIGPLKDMKGLESIDLSINNISNIDALSGLINLKDLNLTSNKISNIDALAGLTSLKSLGLTSNKISNIGVIAGLSNLENLYLGDNQINDISALSGLTKLNELGLRNNQILDISALNGLANLENLDLCNNKITDVKALAGLTKLRGNVQLKTGNNIKDFSPIADFYKPEYEK